MKQMLSTAHKKQFEEIKKSLAVIGSKEYNFVKVELLFYEAMAVARDYGDDVADNGLLAAFKELQANEYQQTKALYSKSVQRERVISRFISRLKTVLTAGAKNVFLQPEFS